MTLAAEIISWTICVWKRKCNCAILRYLLLHQFKSACTVRCQMMEAFFCPTQINGN